VMGTAILLLFVVSWICMALGMSLEEYIKRRPTHPADQGVAGHDWHQSVHFWTV
jgi:hypothetical protein